MKAYMYIVCLGQYQNFEHVFELRVRIISGGNICFFVLHVDGFIFKTYNCDIRIWLVAEN